MNFKLVRGRREIKRKKPLPGTICTEKVVIAFDLGGMGVNRGHGGVTLRATPYYHQCKKRGALVQMYNSLYRDCGSLVVIPGP